jgi:hypothetical protein
MLWCADPGADPADPGAWRAASPHWDAERELLIADAWRHVVSGMVLPDPLERDPVAVFAAQYLNLWPSVEAGDRVPWLVDPVVWRAARRPGMVPPAEVLAAAVEDDFGRGGAVAVAWRDGEGRVCVTSQGGPLPDCWARVRDVPRVVCGLSLRDSEQAAAAGASGVGSREVAAGLSVWRDLLESGRLLWDGPDRLDAEGAGITVVPSARTNQLVLRPGQEATVWRAALFAAVEAHNVPTDGFWVG